MAINFPNSPVNGNTYTYNAVKYVYSKSGTDEGYWRVALPTVSGVATVAEIDAGTNAVKYISPAGLEGSKYGLNSLPKPNNSSFSESISSAVNLKNSPNMAWGGKGISILGDSITHGAFSIDITRNNWQSIVRRAYMKDVGKSNYGFVTAVPSIGTGGLVSKDLHTVTSLSGFSGQSGLDATNSMSGWWYRSLSSGSTIKVKVPTIQQQAAVMYEAAPSNGTFTISVNGVVKATVNSSIGVGGYFKGGYVQLEDDGTGFCEITLTTLDSNPVRVSGFMYENSDNSVQFNSFAQSGRKLREVDDTVLEAAILGATTFILALGHNDSFGTSNSTYMAAFTSKIDYIIATATANNVKVIVADFVWAQPPSNLVRAELKRCADSIPSATYLPFPDHLNMDNSIYSESNLVNTLKLFEDGSHPNIDGHKLIGDVISKELRLGTPTKELGLINNPFWSTIDLSHLSSSLSNISTKHFISAGWRISGGNLNFRCYLWNSGSFIDAGTYTLVSQEDMPEGVMFANTNTVRATNSDDGSTNAVLKFKEGNAGIELVVTAPTYVAANVVVPII